MSFDETSDFEKLVKALSTLTGLFSSLDNILEAFGLSHMPQAQRYGIVFGFLVFVGTVSAVMMLLIWGGSFKRMAEQSKLGAVRIPDVTTARSERPLLYEHYLEARDRMMKQNYPKPETTEEMTALTKMVLNLPIRVGGVPDLVNGASVSTNGERQMPPGYEEDYKEAYLKCVEKPFGSILSGRPECRFEAYARAFAGTGRSVNRDYRRSYARLYEVFTCSSQATDDRFRQLYIERPHDLIGRLARVEALEVDAHLENLYDFTCGNAYLENKPFDPKQIWGFFNYGPFNSPQKLRESPVFQKLHNEASFAIVENVTDRFIGVISLTKDDPENLTIEILPPIVMPSCQDSAETIEGIFLVMDKLFALGYRRIQLAVDTQDATNKRMAAKLGFTKEAEIPKHMVVKDANRDSIIYGMLNTDWNKGARAFLFKKLHGERIQRRDQSWNKKESEMEEQIYKVQMQKKLAAQFQDQEKSEPKLIT